MDPETDPCFLRNTWADLWIFMRASDAGRFIDGGELLAAGLARITFWRTRIIEPAGRWRTCGGIAALASEARESMTRKMATRASPD